MEALEKEIECPICLERMDDPALISVENCKHRFCKTCINQVAEVAPTCPSKLSLFVISQLNIQKLITPMIFLVSLSKIVQLGKY